VPDLNWVAEKFSGFGGSSVSQLQGDGEGDESPDNGGVCGDGTSASSVNPSPTWVGNYCCCFGGLDKGLRFGGVSETDSYSVIMAELMILNLWFLNMYGR
jgi:hypothetical protein